MRLHEILNEVIIDNKKGAGAVPYNQEVDYRGLRVQMSPSIFMNLAAPLDRSEALSVDGLINHIKNNGSIGSPFLDISVPAEWEDGDFTLPAAVKSHEGRNRMYAIQETEGDSPIEVHLFFRNDIRKRHITNEWIKNLNKWLIPERKTTPIKGPFFTI